MHFTIGKSALLAELGLLAGIADKKSTIPVLGNLLIEALGDALTLKATDLDVSLSTRVNAEVEQPGAFCLSAKKLFDIVRRLPDAEVAIKADGDYAKLTCGGSRFKLLSLPKDNFPEIKSHDGTFIAVPSATLRAMIARTIFAITAEESRYSLNGAKLEIGDGRLRMVATDGHRLSFVEAESGPLDAAIDALIPKKALVELAKLTAETETVEMALSDNHAYFRFGPREMSSRLLTGQFPNYDLVLPKENHNRVTVEAAQLAAAVRRVALMADERSHSIKMELGDGQIALSAVSSEAGEAQETLSADYAGPQIVAGFNAQYVLDALSVIEGDAVIAFKDGNAQVEFRAKEESGMLNRLIVMPMRV